MRNLFGLLFFVVALSACAGTSGRGPLWEPTSHRLDLTMAPAGQSTATVDMQVGDYLVLEVRDPDSGGYTPKKPLFDANILQFGGFRYIPPAQKAVFNTFGRFIYTFVALQPGSSEVRVVATPPGENQPSLRKTLARARAVIHP